MLSPTPGQRTEDSGIESQSSPELEEGGARTMSRTHQYRKVMKPMLERKRRARINNCLDELKDLMVGALQTEGESITKLEKADVLELTVRHLRKLKAHGALGLTPTTTRTPRPKTPTTPTPWTPDDERRKSLLDETVQEDTRPAPLEVSWDRLEKRLGQGLQLKRT